MHDERDAGPVGAAAFEVVDLEPGDLDEIADLHLRAFPTSELGRQGVEAVRRNYLWQFEGPHDLTAVGVKVEGRLVGFLFGGTFRGSTIGFLKREWRFLLVQGLRHPSTVFRRAGIERVRLALRLLLRRAPGSPDEAPPEPAVRSFGVLAIAVDPATQGSGVGRAIMAVAEERARAQGYERMHLTVHPDNERAVAFYEAGGWARVAEEGRWIGRMERPILPA
ncbi:MAG: GNAT family N-acetyltransferase [Acidimicrobiales bacterium]